MSDFKKLFRITMKRFGIWILLISILVALANGLGLKNGLDLDSKNFKESIDRMASATNISFELKDKKIDKEFLSQAEEIATAYQEKYNLSENEYKKFDDESDFEKMMTNFQEKYGKDYYSITQPYDMYRNYLRTWKDNGGNKIENSYGGNYIEDLTLPICFFIFVIAILVTSLEESLPYYEFTCMFPWRKKDEIVMKSIMVFIFGLIIFIINYIVGMGLMKASDWGPLINLIGFEIISKMLLMFLATSIFAVALGMIAGNFVGHLGLSIIAIGSFRLIETLIFVIVAIFNQKLANDLSDNYNNIANSLPEFLKPFDIVFNVDKSYPSIAGFLIIAILWAILAYGVNSKISSEKSGLMIISKPVSIWAKTLGILSLTTVIYYLISIVVAPYNMLIKLIIYALGFLISYKIFDVLFKVRLKF